MSSVTKTPPASRLMREAAKINLPPKTRHYRASRLDKWEIIDLVDALVQAALPEDQQTVTKRQIMIRLGYREPTQWSSVQSAILNNLYKRKAFSIPIPKK